MSRPKSDIPVGTQFSPDLIDLGEFIQAAIAHSGDQKALQAAVWTAPVQIRRPGASTTRRNRNLPLEAAVQYGLLEKGSYQATDLTTKLSSLTGQALTDTFARHILLDLGGLRVVEGAEQMAMDLSAGLSSVVVTGDTLARYLTDQGFRVVEHNTAINSLRKWLAEAGLFGKSRGKEWQVNKDIKEKLVGLSDAAIGILASLSVEQLAYVQALCRINPTGPYAAADVRDLAEATFHVRLSRGNLKEVLEPLKQAGLIDYVSGGTKGGKTAQLQTTGKFDADVLVPFVSRTVKTLDSVVSAYYQKRPADIYADLSSTDTFTKGQALEAYAIHVMRLLGLRFVGWRKRAADTTGRGEVDVLLIGQFGALPTLWQVQCKNTPSGKVDLEDVAKEVGQAIVTHATHILIMANSSFTQDARDFALQVMRNYPVTAFLLDKADFEIVKASSGKLGEILQGKAEQIVNTRAQASAFAPAARGHR